MDSLVLKSFIPELFLVFFVLSQLIFNIRLTNNLQYNFPVLSKETLSQVFFALICTFFLLATLKIHGYFFSFLLLNNESTVLIKKILTLIVLMSLAPIYRSYCAQALSFFEFFNLFILLILSFFAFISSFDLMSVYLTLEMQALCLYTFACFKRNSSSSSEAGLKYFISGSFISCLFLFGSSLIYGALGTLNFNEMALMFTFSFLNEFKNLEQILLLGVFLITITLFFKTAAAPFHFWLPDVYDGSPLSSSILFIIIPKIVIFSFLTKWVLVLSSFFFQIQDLFLVSGLLSLVVGTFFAFKQKRLKRLIIYSSVAQIGFLIISLYENSLESISALFFYLFVYILTSVLIWCLFSLFYDCESKRNRFYFTFQQTTTLFLSALSNFFKTNAIWSVLTLLVLFSVGGIPPFVGFLAKVFVVISLLNNNMIVVPVIVVLISAASVFYYVRAIKILFFETSSKRSLLVSFLQKSYLLHFECFLIVTVSFLLIFLFFRPCGLLLIAQYFSLCLLNL